MKYTWETTDIRGGRVVTIGPIVDYKYIITRTYMIGYTVADDKSNSKETLISLADGHIMMFTSKEVLAKHLNDSKMVPIANNLVGLYLYTP